MKGQWLWAAVLAVPVIVGGLLYAGMQADVGRSADETGFICPLTGEELPCPFCCPLN